MSISVFELLPLGSGRSIHNKVLAKNQSCDRDIISICSNALSDCMSYGIVGVYGKLTIG